MTETTREFDIIVYGATGYTGRLVAEHFVREYGGKSDGPKWAMAGRNRAKLEDVRTLIGAPDDTPLVVADADDPASLDSMAARTRVVLTTVGPYQLYGESVLAACVKAGTHYADLCGEPVWMHRMIEKYDAQAKESGARVSFSSGFDSIPFDLGVLMLQAEAVRRFGKPAPRVKGRVRKMEGTFSGGTAASFKATMASAAKKPREFAQLQDPFLLCGDFSGPDQPGGLLPVYDDELESWAAPFIMAGINTKNVHRTNFLSGHQYGEDFRYDEMVLTSPGDMGKAAAKAIGAALKAPFGDGGPKPGEGPSPEERENGFYDLLFIGLYPDGKSLKYAVKGKYDPGYGSTSRMLGETGMALLESDHPGGIGTPGAILGEKLVARLRERAELSFAPED
ncbi:MAG: saccharopine dehydrogenase [Sphingomonadales bacterium CG12_big_fil_rev_8_21_14_0_65_65_10]|uniref:Saccharopine dehydrogenase n=1 Tax=Blastomonas marina TaxID=1867408 RepID=A0ABQ1F422_9SPHN|nr:saccharopine dehydrogenase NADP-binding domain-containing protein [Blastomonas marina]PIW55849.1 MAG: saccharopine dehydrogenase [Sphingomonadales bacterium CG12_big_fil_rev_8_21_14_0_65_65_10]GFZ98026.1 saccharopine dehydrogenase [Blastomonas marina]